MHGQIELFFESKFTLKLRVFCRDPEGKINPAVMQKCLTDSTEVFSIVYF